MSTVEDFQMFVICIRAILSIFMLITILYVWPSIMKYNFISFILTINGHDVCVTEILKSQLVTHLGTISLKKLLIDASPYVTYLRKCSCTEHQYSTHSSLNNLYYTYYSNYSFILFLFYEFVLFIVLTWITFKTLKLIHLSGCVMFSSQFTHINVTRPMLLIIAYTKLLRNDHAAVPL
ncbi:hypothetical protein AGLY_001411 [Aphis glycines]|uniref:Uncharacterized protein n=1 Tax=Aphis glycines TaxID=307491 RepID=A0A6G0U7H4_APHGL|nr:hypothetical protein AGLY_001411 [Aphis glycines]